MSSTRACTFSWGPRILVMNHVVPMFVCAPGLSHFLPHGGASARLWEVGELEVSIYPEKMIVYVPCCLTALTPCVLPLERRDELYQLWERILSERKNTASLSLSCVNNPSPPWVFTGSRSVCSYTWASPSFFASTLWRWAPHCLPRVLTGFLSLRTHQDASVHGEGARACVHWARTQASGVRRPLLLNHTSFLFGE